MYDVIQKILRQRVQRKKIEAKYFMQDWRYISILLLTTSWWAWLQNTCTLLSLGVHIAQVTSTYIIMIPRAILNNIQGWKWLSCQYVSLCKVLKSEALNKWKSRQTFSSQYLKKFVFVSICFYMMERVPVGPLVDSLSSGRLAGDQASDCLILLWNEYQVLGKDIYTTIFKRITDKQCPRR